MFFCCCFVVCFFFKDITSTFSIRVWLSQFSIKIIYAFSFFLEFLLLAICFCLYAAYQSFNLFSVQCYHFFQIVSFSPNCPSSSFISSKAKHNSLLSEFISNLMKSTCAQKFYIVFSHSLLIFHRLYQCRAMFPGQIKHAEIGQEFHRW